jgi:protein TonB
MAYPGPQIETLDMREESAGGRRRRSLVAPASFGLHAAGIVALLLVPLLTSNALPDPTTAGVRAFFVEPAGLAPPPPPPPPPAPAAAASRVPPKSVVTEPAPSEFTAPIEVPDEIKPEDTLDVGGLEGGMPGGVEGGVPGGVIGGIVGGLPAAAPPPPGPVTLRVGGQVKEPKKVKHVSPVYPELAAKARLAGIVILEAIIAPNGTVRDVKVLRGQPLLDEAAVDAVRQWVYTPTLLGGIPVQIALVVTVTFNVTQSVAASN